MDLDIIMKIAEKTIGFDLEGVKASTPEEIEEYEKYCEENNILHLSSKPSNTPMPDYYKGRKEYKPTYEEEIIIKTLIKCNDISKFNISINDNGELIVRTPKESWWCLAGREWLVDLKNKSVRLIAMS